ncbi:MAG: anhydro-N-acetylmuramic acid kinase [Saprospiraceae bacterium]
MIKSYFAIGLMSGSSLDGLDIAFCRFDYSGDRNAPIADWELLISETIPFAETWVTRLSNLPDQPALIFAKTHTYFGHYLAELVNTFCAKHKVKPDFIASHGHTIYHHPDKFMTTQIGDGGALAALTGYTVVSDFRTQDIALHGEGTPIAPAADRYLFQGYDFYLNIGGIANVTAVTENNIVAFDIAPANQILNRLANQVGQAYDHNGEIASSGAVDKALFDELNRHPYFAKAYPKSLDNQQILKEVFPLYNNSSTEIPNKLHTACKHLAHQTAQAIVKIIRREKINKSNFRLLVSGGGALNYFLMKCIQEHCEREVKLIIEIPDLETIQFKEAILMGLMGLLRLKQIPNCFASVTGGKRDTIGGAVYLGRSLK